MKIIEDVDQFLRIDQGQGIVQMGDQQDQLNFEEEVFDDFAIVFGCYFSPNLKAHISLLVLTECYNDSGDTGLGLADSWRLGNEGYVNGLTSAKA